MPKRAKGSSATLAPRQKAVDILRFPEPEGKYDELRLVLTKNAIGKSTPPFGFKLSKEKLLAGARPTSARPDGAESAEGPGASVAASPPPDAAPQGGDPAEQGAAGEAAAEPAPKPRPSFGATPPPDRKAGPRPGDPPSITELIRQSVENDKKEEAQRQKEKQAGEKPAGEEPAAESN